MAILNYTTKVAASKTVAEIQSKLTKWGARKFITDHNDCGSPVALTFGIPLGGRYVLYSLPCNWEGVLAAMKNGGGVPKSSCTAEQALRVSWRIIKTWVEAQLAIVEAGQAAVAEVFLAYSITKSGETLYRFIESGESDLLLSQAE